MRKGIPIRTRTVAHLAHRTPSAEGCRKPFLIRNTCSRVENCGLVLPGILCSMFAQELAPELAAGLVPVERGPRIRRTSTKYLAVTD